MTVVYQYKAGGEAWMEIVYSMRSLKHLEIASSRCGTRNDAGIEVMFCGDIPLLVDADKVMHLPAGSDKGRYLDSHHKLYAMCRDERVSDPFLLMYDDVYFLKPCKVDAEAEPFNLTAHPGYLPEVIAQGNMEDIKSVNDFSGTGSNRWKETLLETYRTLKKMELPTWNFETHLPRIVRKQQMLHVIEKFGLLQHALQRWTCYFNYYLNVPEHPRHTTPCPSLELTRNTPRTVEEMPEVIGRFYSKETKTSYGNDYSEKKLTKLLEHKLILNHSDRGLKTPLKHYIMKRFPDASRWECGSVLSALKGKTQLAA